MRLAIKVRTHETLTMTNPFKEQVAIILENRAET